MLQVCRTSRRGGDEPPGGSDLNPQTAKYWNKCACGTRCRRHIFDRSKDLFRLRYWRRNDPEGLRQTEIGQLRNQGALLHANQSKLGDPKSRRDWGRSTTDPPGQLRCDESSRRLALIISAVRASRPRLASSTARGGSDRARTPQSHHQCCAGVAFKSESWNQSLECALKPVRFFCRNGAKDIIKGAHPARLRSLLIDSGASCCQQQGMI